MEPQPFDLPMNPSTQKMTPEEYRKLLRQVRAEQPIVSSEEARRQYLEFHPGSGPETAQADSNAADLPPLKS